MGLLLSVLVACVGVVELLVFSFKVTRNLVTCPGNELTHLSENHLEDIEERGRNRCNGVRNSTNHRSSSNVRVVISEDIEVEFTRNVVTAKPESPTPRRFLLTEKEIHDRSRADSPRRFVITTDTADGHEKKIPKFTVVEQEGAAQQHFLIKDVDGRERSPIPLPKQFIVAEKELGIFKVEGKPCSTSSLEKKVEANVTKTEETKQIAQKLESSVNGEKLSSLSETRTDSEVSSKKAVSNKLLLSEDIEVEFSQNVITAKPRSPTPRRFLLTEKENHDRSRSGSPRRFVITKDTEDGDKQKIPKFTVLEEKEGASHQHFLLRDVCDGEELPVTLPKQFIVTERELGIFKVEGKPCLLSETDCEIKTKTEREENKSETCTSKKVLPNESKADVACQKTASNGKVILSEDIEIEFAKNVVSTRARSPSPRRFLLTEKENHDRSRSPTPRRFVITNDTEDGERKQIPKFTVEGQEGASQHFVIRDVNNREKSPIPLPKQFIVTEKELGAFKIEGQILEGEAQQSVSIENKLEISENEKTVLKKDLEIGENACSVLDSKKDLDVDSKLIPRIEKTVCSEVEKNSGEISRDEEHKLEVLVNEETCSTSKQESVLAERSRSPSPIPRRLGEQDTFRRSPSPYPPLVLPVPRNSICNELVDNPVVSVVEVDEELSRSPTPENIDQILETKTHTVQSTSNNLEVPKRKDRSRSPECKRKHENEIDEDAKFDELFLDSLDGVKKKKICASRKSRKTREKENCLPSSSDNDAQIAKTLTEAANVLKNVNREDGEKPGSSKKPEPEAFWLIFSGEYTKAMNKDWHGQHFCCWQCDESLTGQRYVLRDEHPYCVSCYESVFANSCEKCSRIIGIDSKDLSYKDKHWHEACFLCTTCGESLVDRQFGSKGDRIYCGRCYDEQFASRCDGCHEIFRAGTKKMEYKTRQWHEKCFCCCVCKVPIGTQSFIPREQEIYCAKCYEEKFATRCIKCNKVITSGGVTYKNEPWHRECFTCTHCTKSLAGERFTSRDEKPYCAECFGELFAKRCFACNKPITGIGGTKFISFEDRHWHNDCFYCASCRTSLVGRGFITDQDDIICPECAKQKLI